MAVCDGLAVRIDPTGSIVQAGVGRGRRGRGGRKAVVGMRVDHNWGVGGGGGGGEEEAGDSQEEEIHFKCGECLS